MKLISAWAFLLIHAATVSMNGQTSQNVLLIGFDTDNTWKYDINNGDRTGTGWEAAGYDDSAWPAGPAGLGFDVSVNGVPIRTVVPYVQNGVVTYFRKHFTFSAKTNNVALSLRECVDDGAVYYLNGKEVFRSRLPAGPINFTTPATTAPDPTPIAGPFSLPATNLVSGDNVLAVEVHQNSSTSSDLDFAAELIATISSVANVPPALEPITDQIASVGRTLLVTNRASDSPSQKLSFILEAGGPTGASINPTNGLFRWTPTLDYASTTNRVRVIVTDNGEPSLSATGSFVVVVADYLEPDLGGAVVRAGQSTNVPLVVFSSVAITNLQLALEYPMGRLSGFALSNLNSALASGSWQSVSATRSIVYFTNAPGQSLIGTQQLAQLTFTAVSNQSSAFVPVKVTDLQAKRLDGSAVFSLADGLGRVVVIGEAPLLETVYVTNGQVRLTIFGQAGTTNRIESSSDLISWTFWQSVILTNLLQTVSPVAATNGSLFFRAMSFRVGPVSNRFDNSTPLALPDRTTNSSLINISGLAGHITNVTVSMSIAHAFDSDLQIDLIGPDATTVRLVSNRGEGGRNLGTNCVPDSARMTLSDAAAAPISSGAAPFVGLFHPEAPLAAFAGKTGPGLNGTWRLRIADTQNGDAGTLNCWSLMIQVGP